MGSHPSEITEERVAVSRLKTIGCIFILIKTKHCSMRPAHFESEIAAGSPGYSLRQAMQRAVASAYLASEEARLLLMSQGLKQTSTAASSP